MSVFLRLRFLFNACLLGLLTVSCQRANYSFRAANENAPVTSPPLDSAALVTVRMPLFVTPEQVTATLPSPANHRKFARAATPKALPIRMPSHLLARRITRVSYRAHPRAASNVHRSSALSEDTKFLILLLGGALLLVGGGLVLVFGVGGWLAVASGGALVLTGLCLGLFCLYVSLLGHQSMH